MITLNDFQLSDNEIHYWMSTSSSYDPDRSDIFGHRCMISVVFDSGTDKCFSGVRLIIVSEKHHDQLNNNVIITDCLQTSRYEITPPAGRSPRYRDALAQHWTRTKLSQQLLNSASDEKSLPLCTVVYELVATSTDVQASASLVPRPDIVPSPSSPSRIIYDRTHPLSPTQHSIVVFLDSDLTFGRFPFPLPKTSIVIYGIRIIPISANRMPFRVLPPDVLRNIVRCAFQDKTRGWRSDLLAIGLVCKDWSHVLEMFFSGISSIPNRDKPTALSVAHSLERKPERIGLVHTFNPLHYRWNLPQSESEAEYIDTWQGLIALLRAAKSLKTIHVFDTHTSLRSCTVDALCQLQEVQYFRLHRRPSRLVVTPDVRMERFTMRDLQAPLANWKNLREFSATLWACAQDIENSTEIPPFTCSIEDLYLEFGKITGLEFLRFASHNLQKLILYRVEGLSNCDLLAFLFQVSSTLSILEIQKSTFLRTSDDEEHALDATMSSMFNLLSVKIGGNIATHMAIARKPPRIKRHPLLTPERSSIMVTGLSANVASVIAALEVSGWESVTLIQLSASMWDSASREWARNVAKSRNINIAFHCKS